MASDEIINEIWEVAQENSIDSIDKSEFGKDLRKAVFAELERATEGVISDINNEFARALPIILHQAKANPELIYENNGKGFSVASGILTKAVLTVKYENRYIPGTAEYKKEFPKESLENIVLTAATVENMIKNFDSLSNEERNLLSENWENLTSTQIDDIMDGIERDIDNDPNFSDSQKKNIKSTISQFRDAKDMLEFIKNLPSDEQQEAISEFIKNRCSESSEFRQRYEMIKGSMSDADIFYAMLNDTMTIGKGIFDSYNAYKSNELTAGEFDTEALKRYSELSEKIGSIEGLSNVCSKYGYIPTRPNIFQVKQVNSSDPRIENTTEILSSTPMDGLHRVANYMGLPSIDGFRFSSGVSFATIKRNLEIITAEKSEEHKFSNGEDKNGIENHNDPLVEMIQTLSEEEVADLFGDELKDLLRKKAEELGISEEDKKTLEAMIASKDDDSFADLFYDDREGFLQELEKMSLLQHAKKQPVTDQEYGPTYRANAEEMVVDSKGLYKAQTDIKKINEQDGAGTGEGSDASTSGTAVVQNNDTLEVDTINTHQPATNSFINTARREGAEKDGKDLKGEKDGEGLEDVPPENDLPDNATPNNSTKNANIMSVARNMRASTDDMQDIGSITITKMKEIEEKEKKKTEPNTQQQGAQQQGGLQQGDESTTTELSEIE